MQVWFALDGSRSGLNQADLSMQDVYYETKRLSVVSKKIRHLHYSTSDDACRADHLHKI